MNNKKLAKIAKNLFKLSLSNGFVDNSKVRNILTHLDKSKQSGKIQILKHYKKQIAEKLTKETVVVEAASQITPGKQFEEAILSKTKAKNIKYEVNPDFVFGAKVTAGDWIFDSTLDAKLRQLSND
ncbi:F0F1 ATP synthase subunit delta [Candidatus Curtissbacteria bacterium]|nr:F0F1 ATP synthase subunit delta [Candidatus Curtissbacteria bacterium]